MEKLNINKLLIKISNRLKTKVGGKIVTNFKKGDFLQIEWVNSLNETRTIFGKCINYKKNSVNSTFTLLYATDKYRVIETFPLYSKSLKNIIVFKKK